jgi:hypothetical protein
MRSALPGIVLCCVLTAFLFMVVSCNQDEIATKKSIASKKAVGSWLLTGIKSGWTGETSPPTQKVMLVIDNQQQGIIYENEKDVLRFQYTLDENYSGLLRYSIIQQTGTSTIFYPPVRGNFRVSTKQLIIGDTGVDGNDYIFERN